MNRRVLASLLVIAVVAGLVGAGTWAWFTDTEAEVAYTTNARVEVGERTGFPLEFYNLTPDVTTDWKQVSIKNDSTIPADLYIGEQVISNTCPGLPDKLTVDIHRWLGGDSWESVYHGGGYPLFTQWWPVADNMPASATYYYRVRITLDKSADNTYQGCDLASYVLLHAAQYNGLAPSGTPSLP